MNYIKDDIKTLYFRLLIPSMVGAVVMSIYSFVDTIAVGQSEGVPGTGAMAVIAPIYGVIVFLGILCGIGGSVMMSIARGEGNREKGDACFTAACLLMAIITVTAWIVLIIFQKPIFQLFGANADVMPKTVEYGRMIIWFLPVFVFTIFIPSFIRNDGAPKLVMAAVVTGGCVNIFGDWFLVFPMKMGMTGAALATVIGTMIQAVIMGSYFFRKRCRLKFVRPNHFKKGFLGIVRIGIGAGALDLGIIIIGIVMNNQILRYGSTTELAIYGVLATLMSLIQALFCGVGQAIQPLVSTNYGAGKGDRIRTVWRYSIVTAAAMGIVFMLIGELFPVQITRLFMKAGPEVIAAAPEIFRLFSIVYLFLGITVVCAYYLQSVMKEKASMVVGFMHSMVLSTLLCMILPVVFGMSGVWLALPATELLISLLGVLFITKRVNPMLNN